MKCPFTSPHVVTRLDGTRKSINIPCGCCPACVKNHSMQMYPRILESLNHHQRAIFFTLTLREEHVIERVDPKTGLVIFDQPLLKKFIQSALKRTDTRLRRKYNIIKPKKPQYDYYFCMEYGPNTCRTHLHGLIIHNYDDNDFRPLYTEWAKDYGFCVFKPVAFSDPNSKQKVSHYVTKYTTKGQASYILDAARRHVCSKPWRIYSSGLGREFLTRSNLSYYRAEDIKRSSFVTRFQYINTRADTILSRMHYRSNGINYPMPKYYKDKIIPKLRIKLEKNDISGKSAVRYLFSEAGTLSLLFELAILRKSLQVHLESLHRVAACEKIRDIDKIFAISEKERIFAEKQNYNHVCAKVAADAFRRKQKLKLYLNSKDYE